MVTCRPWEISAHRAAQSPFHAPSESPEPVPVTGPGSAGRGPRVGSISGREHEMITIEIENPAEVAANESVLARAFGWLAPRLV